jgi:tripartite-type tricarboxylate transporter receptor subunit TctC
MVRISALIGVLAACMACVGPAQAQSYPSKPVRLIVPFPPGGSTDTMARTLGQKLGETLGQTFVIENRPGAGGNIGIEAAVKSPADGYTIVIGSTSTLAVNPTLYKNLPFDPAKDLSPVALLAYVSNILVVNPSLPVSDTRSLIALLKANPGKYYFASPGSGNSSHLAAELFKSMAGVQMTHVPYKGDVAAITDLIAGRVQIMFQTAVVALPQIKAGSVKPIAVGAPRRLPALPDVPTVTESGVPGFDASAWFGILAPAGVPREILAKLNAEINRTLAVPEVRERFLQLGVNPGNSSIEEFTAYMASERIKWAKTVLDSGARVD